MEESAKKPWKKPVLLDLDSNDIEAGVFAAITEGNHVCIIAPTVITTQNGSCS